MNDSGQLKTSADGHVGIVITGDGNVLRDANPPGRQRRDDLHGDLVIVTDHTVESGSLGDQTPDSLLWVDFTILGMEPDHLVRIVEDTLLPAGPVHSPGDGSVPGCHLP